MPNEVVTTAPTGAAVDHSVTPAQLQALLLAPKAEQTAALENINLFLAGLTAQQRVAWGLAYLTYQFIDQLTERLNLNLKVYQAGQTQAWQEARFGKLWEQGIDGLEKYNRINKVEPMQRALAELNVGTWFAGLRRSQSSTREALPILAISGKRFKLLPIIEWSNKDVHMYLTEHDLPYHPLWEQGYVSVGDTHSSKPLELGMSEEETRFNGLQRECGLHFDI